ncbi:MAG: GtrA family protein [Patescibacteria group bacterium]|jgi:putative flippase GtrA|nr:GtrA family protein [Patescibacteria group bacterium]MDD3778251.1 GtrA family protein [Patescibacteria group bacterium]MDD3939291.1 GtrA family protein [Patescibacteria group bacterium]MDD4443929.1 GtrA family protein [Patescibacteria group bacterium]NCU39540.1 GtrA family protein [Candidatus Falkowbacteria bacterium]
MIGRYINNSYRQLRQGLACHFPRLFPLIDAKKAVIKYFIAGVSATLVNLISLAFFHGFLKINLLLATSLAFVVSFVVSFSLQKFWTFRNYHYKKIPLQLILYIINAFIGLSINVFLMNLLVNKWGAWYLLAQFIVSFIIGVYNFFAYNFVIFKKS